jgi:hypothetical protein
MWRRRRVRRDGSRPVMSTAVPPPGRVCQGRNVSSCGRNNHVKAMSIFEAAHRYWYYHRAGHGQDA